MKVRTILTLAVIALVVAVLRYYMRGWTATIGWPPIIGSLLASVTILVLVGLAVIFVQEGRASEGRYLRGAVAFLLLAAWCQALVIAGILVTQQTGASNYYNERLFEQMRFPSASRHALAHAVAFLPVAAVELLLGGLIYWLARRGRRAKPALASQH